MVAGPVGADYTATALSGCRLFAHQFCTFNPSVGKMAKKKKPVKKSSSRRATPAAIQKKIEKLDRDLADLIAQRGALSQQAGELQLEAGQPVFDPAAEAETIRRIIAAHKGPCDEHAVAAIAREVVSGCRQLVQPLRVAYLGPEYSYSHLAAIEKFGQSVHLVGVGSIATVFEKVLRHEVDYGLAPIENSTDGRVVDTLSMFARVPARICGEVQLKIHHYLLGRCQHDQVRDVFSKPQALSQCRQWLARNLPAARTREVASTAAAAQLAAEREGAAAIASYQAGVNHGLDVIAADIEDNSNNVTRFAVIGHEQPRATRKDKTSIMFEIPHQAGSLADALNIFKRSSLNLTWIESFPQHDSEENEYLFFAELEGNASTPSIKKALDALKRKTDRLEILGSYARTEPV